ncbi:MAG: prephenate dehydrogenase/arogenate dehydrogenase family protein [Candidatus Hydrogenedentes bacterium]|nr:prephenate dehydrogenase/arogenate dehydrogenase family protein [Candidatus Hydrogenedentota bacterium]
MSKPIMTIVGFGPMGKRFAHLFSSDMDVRVSSSRNVADEVASVGAVSIGDRGSALASSDYIFLAVPLKALPDLIEEVNAVSRAGVVVIDCCSARVSAEKLLSRLDRRHFGIHDVIKGEYCITGDINEEMTQFFCHHGIKIQCMTAEEHDRINAVIGLGHFIGLSLGQFLGDDEKAILSGMGSGSKVIALANHFAGTSPTTWRETQVDNTFTRKKREDFIRALIQYHDALSNGEYPFE